MSTSVKNETVITANFHDPTPFFLEAGSNYIRAPYVLTGATGTGKTTFCLIALFSNLHREGKKCCFIQPTMANLSNLLNLWDTVVIPTLSTTTNPLYKEYTSCPKPGRDVVEVSPSTPTVNVVVADDFNEYLSKKRDLPAYDWFIVDEYHLVISAVATTVMALRANGFRNVIYISATPEGSVPAISAPRNVDIRSITASENDLVFNDNFFDKSPLNPLYYMKTTNVSNPCVVFFAPTRAVLLRVQKFCTERQCAFWIVTERSTPIQYATIQKAAKAGNCVIGLVPTVEAGTEFPAHIAIDPGLTFGYTLENNVLLQVSRPLLPHERMQRAGRIGRSGFDSIMYANSFEPQPAPKLDDAYAFIYAQAIVTVAALGINVSTFSTHPAYKRFRRLASLTRAAAEKALETSPHNCFIESYRWNKDGELFFECGGLNPTVVGFAQQNIDDLRVFVSNGPASAPISTTFILPVFDAVNPSFDPYQLVKDDQQQTIIEAITKHYESSIATVPFERQIDLLMNEFDLFATTIFSALSRVIQPTVAAHNAYTYTGHRNEIAMNRLIITCGGPDADFAKLILRIAQQPGVTVGEDHYVHMPPGNPIVDTAATTSRDRAHRARHARGRTAIEDSIDLLTDDVDQAATYLVEARDSLQQASITDDNLVNRDKAAAIIDAWEKWNDIGYTDNTGVYPAVNTAPGSQIDLTTPDGLRLSALLNAIAGITPNFVISLVADDPAALTSRTDTLAVTRATFDRTNAIIAPREQRIIQAQAELDRRTSSLNDQRTALANYPAFVVDPNPVMTPSTEPSWKALPYIEYTPPGGTTIKLPLYLQRRFVGQDNHVDVYAAAKEVFKVITPRLGIVALRSVKPELFVYLSDLYPLGVVPRDCRWYYDNNH